jgi:hypothetical protein
MKRRPSIVNRRLFIPQVASDLPLRLTLQYRPEAIRCGYWMSRLVGGGPEMPACILLVDHEPGNPENVLDTGPILVAAIGLDDVEPYKVLAMRERREITEEEYDFQMQRLAWIRDYAPAEPEARPARAVSIAELKPVGPRE